MRAKLIILGDGVQFTRRTLGGVWRGAVFRYFSEVLRQASILVTGSVVIVLGLVFAIGLTVGVEAVYSSRQIGAPSISGAFTSLANLREAAPYAFGFMMAAKVSTGYVAEIGTMRISEEIDALDVMGLDTVAYLASTRVLATWIVTPFIFATAIVVGYIASFLVVVVQVAEVSPGGYLYLFWQFQSPLDYLFSGIKMMLMAAFVVLVGCYYGYRVRGGPVEVGQATARAMLVNVVGIQVISLLTTQLFWGLDPNLGIGG